MLKLFLIAIFSVALLASCTANDVNITEPFQMENPSNTSSTTISASQTSETTFTERSPQKLKTVRYDMLYPIYVDGHYKYIDKNGIVVTDSNFDKAYMFSDGMAKVCINQKWGYIDLYSNQVISCQYDFCDEFSEGLAGVEINDKYGYIDKTGKTVIEPKYYDVMPFSCGLARVTTEDTSLMSFDFINKDGIVVLKDMGTISSFVEDVAFTRSGTYLDKSGQSILETDMMPGYYPYYIEYFMFSDDILLYPYVVDDTNIIRYKYLDKKGDLIFDRTFDDATSFNEGLAVVKQDGKTGVIDKTGEFVFYNQNIDCKNYYSEGMLPYKDKQSNKTGFIDKEGNIVIEAKYDAIIKEFENGLALVETDGKLAYINNKNDIIYKFDKPDYSFWNY